MYIADSFYVGVRFIHSKEGFKMTKGELISSIAKQTTISKASAEKIINSFTESVTKALRKGDKLTLPGFGTFSVVKRGARIGRNPQNGNEIKIPAMKAAKFKAGNLLKDAVK